MCNNCLSQFAINWALIPKGAFERKHDIFTSENNMLFSQVNRSTLLWLHNKSPVSQQKNIFKWYNIFLNTFQKHFEKYFTRSLGSIVKFFSTLEDKFRISARPCNILHFLICNNSIASCNKRSFEIERMFFFFQLVFLSIIAIFSMNLNM